MKKSVILVILVIYIASFFIVGFFGEKMRAYDPNVRVKSLECYMTVDDKTVVDTSVTANKTYKDLREREGFDYLFNYDFGIENVANGLQVVLVFRVLPENANNKLIHYTVSSATETDGKKKYVFEDKGDGTATFTFYEPFTLDFVIVADDVGADVHVKARITVQPTREYYIQYML